MFLAWIVGVLVMLAGGYSLNVLDKVHHRVHQIIPWLV